VRGLKPILVTAISFGLLSGSAVGVAAQDPDAFPVEFTSQTSWSSQPSAGVEERHGDGARTLTGEAWQFDITESSDPRIDGTMTLTLTSETYPLEEVDVHAEAYRIENEGGVWQELSFFHAGLPWHVEDDGEATQHFFVGEDGYEGWAIVAEQTWTGDGFELHGFIIKGELPITPGPWSAE
jgi:hypothetical protein